MSLPLETRLLIERGLNPKLLGLSQYNIKPAYQTRALGSCSTSTVGAGASPATTTGCGQTVPASGATTWLPYPRYSPQHDHGAPILSSGCPDNSHRGSTDSLSRTV